MTEPANPFTFRYATGDEFPDDSEADRDIAEAETFRDALWSIAEKYDAPLTNNAPGWNSEGRFCRMMPDFIVDVEKAMKRFGYSQPEHWD